MDSTIQNYSGKKVIVGLTGRVGSCVAAFLLKKQGMHVIGVSIVTNSNDNFSEDKFASKCHIQDLDAVKKFCDDMKIPFYATDSKSQFEAEVMDPLISKRLTGTANSSCFDCTKMRIQILHQKMKLLKADYISTGHFCKVQRNLTSDEFYIHSNNDSDSDQSFLLSGVDEEYLKHLILPLGELRKEEVEKIAMRFNLKCAPSRSNSSFCFKDKESYESYATAKIPKSLLKEGQVQNKDTEIYHGDHNGMVTHYLTERELDFKGVSPTDKDLEIVGFDFQNNLIQIGSRKNLTFKATQVTDLKLSSGLDKKKPIMCFLKNKYSHEYVKCNLFFKNNASALIEFEGDVYPLINEEVVVFFDRDTRNAKIIGKGKIGQVGDFKMIDRAHEFRSRDDDEQEEYAQEIFKF